MFKSPDFKRYTSLYTPVLIEQGFAVLTGLLATVMLRSVSEAAMAGVGLLSIINFMLIHLFASISTGVTVAVSQRVGAEDFIGAGKISVNAISFTFYISAAVGIIMTVFSSPIIHFIFQGADSDVLEAASIYFAYSSISLPLLSISSIIAGIMRAEGNTRSPMLGSVLLNTIFVIVASIGIYGLSLDVHGAGAALLFGRLVSSLFLALLIIKGRTDLYLPRLTFKPDIKALHPVFKIAIPSGVDSLIFNGGKLVVSIFLSGMGKPVLVANAIVNNLINVINLPGIALQVVCVTIIGQAWGSKEYDKAKANMFKITGAGMILAAAVCIPMLFFVDFSLGLFNPSQETFDISKISMIVTLIATPLFWPAAFVLPNMLRAANQATYTMVVSVVSMILLRVLLAYILGVHFGLTLLGIWLAMISDWIGRGIFFSIRALRLKVSFDN